MKLRAAPPSASNRIMPVLGDLFLDRAEHAQRTLRSPPRAMMSRNAKPSRDIDIVGETGTRLNDRWATGPETYLGLMVAGFEVPHAHLHVVPIDHMGHLDFAHADTSSDPADLDDVASELKNALDEMGHGVAS